MGGSLVGDIHDFDSVDHEEADHDRYEKQANGKEKMSKKGI